MNEQDRLLIEQLISVLYEQSQAIQALASSNMALVRAIAESDGDTDGEPMTYMDGTPRQ
jgi:hypothetical protein